MSKVKNQSEGEEAFMKRASGDEKERERDEKLRANQTDES